MDNFFFLLLICSCIPLLWLLFYPLRSRFRMMLAKNPPDKKAEFERPVSIIIAAYNEELYVRDKILFFLNKDEWIAGSELIVVSCGSTDRTNSILTEFNDHPSVKVITSDEHLLKCRALNLAVRHSSNNILIFSDCRQVIKKGSVRKLLQYFSDESVGTVNSTIADSGMNGKPSPARRLLNRICLNDSASGSSFNIHGALYAQRREVFTEFPSDVLFDDLFAIASTLAKGKRLVQSPEAVIYDIHFDTYYSKERIERLARGLIVFLVRHWSLVKKISKRDRYGFLTFKYLKLALPFLATGIVIGTAYFTAAFFPELLALAIIITGLLMFNSRIRKYFLLAFRVNFYFMSATIKFFFMNERHIGWKKLEQQQLGTLNRTTQ